MAHHLSGVINRAIKPLAPLILPDSKNAVDFRIQKCYIVEKKQPPTKWLASLRYVKNKPTSIRLRLQGRFIYFRLLFLLSKQASNAIRKLPPKNNRLKISYVLSICTTSRLFQMREAHHLVTRLLLTQIIAHRPLSGNHRILLKRLLHSTKM